MSNMIINLLRNTRILFGADEVSVVSFQHLHREDSGIAHSLANIAHSLANWGRESGRSYSWGINFGWQGLLFFVRKTTSDG